MKTINVAIFDAGARGHAIAWKTMQSPQAGTVHMFPGNGGTVTQGCKNWDIAPIPENYPIIITLMKQLTIGLAVVQQDNALADGLVDVLTEAGIPTFGSSQPASHIESSKIFAKELMRRTGIPTAHFEVFQNFQIPEALEYARSKDGECVVKADGLALGKGVRVCNDIAEATEAINDFMVRDVLKGAGREVVIEDLLEGVELSTHFLCDGSKIQRLPPLRDHKQLQDGGEGPMTGGMGVCGPIDVSFRLLEKIEQEIVLPCIRELYQKGMPFKGLLYPGLMLTDNGPMVLEFNARFGDPETQAYMMLLEDDVDLIEVFMACIEERLSEIELRWKHKKCVVVTYAAEGYPDAPRRGDPVHLPYNGEGRRQVFHGGTAWRDGKLVTNGGRVLSVGTLIDDSSKIKKAYTASSEDNLYFHGMQYRHDIGATW